MKRFFKVTVAIALFVLFQNVAYSQVTEIWLKRYYTKREVNIPMRDGAKLFTAIYEPRNSKGDSPVVMLRTPYGTYPYGNEYNGELCTSLYNYVENGYIVVFQSVRGTHMSEGDMIHVRPEASVLEQEGTDSEEAAFWKEHHGTTSVPVDDATDTYDTIEWLLANAKTNGRVGVKGVSYLGYYSTIAATCGHPALKAVSPQAPVTDWFIGDDFHHNGALMLADTYGFGFRVCRPRYSLTQGFPAPLATIQGGSYEYFKGVPINDIFSPVLDSIPFVRDIVNHPDYDYFWQHRNAATRMKDIAPAMLIVGGEYDAEDCYGALELYRSVKKNSPSTEVYLVEGPWSHGAWDWFGYDHLDGAYFGKGSSKWFVDHIEFPFFQYYLEGKGNKPAEVAVLPSGETSEAVKDVECNSEMWIHSDTWPLDGTNYRSLYLNTDASLTFDEPVVTKTEFREYVSDPASPVPYYHTDQTSRPASYMAADQTFASQREDVLTYTSDVLEEPLFVAGPIKVSLDVSVSGTDADFIVKLIDVRPDGYQMLVRGDVMAARYREGFTSSKAMESGKVTPVTYSLNDICHKFMPGHRIMVQVQSSWFPLVAMNPQTFVENQYKAVAEDYKPQTVRVFGSKKHLSSIEIPVVESRVMARQVPERADDFVWENDKVCYRAYGPALEKETISPGFDVWVKSTDKLVADSWYAMNAEGKRSYHKNYGEGKDCYKVGVSLGAGASAPVVDGHLVLPDHNYKSWRILEKTPDKVVFQLAYAPWTVDGRKVSLVKTITVESGSNFCLAEDRWEGDFDVLTVAAGAKLHGVSKMASGDDWFAFWEAASDQDAEKDPDSRIGISVCMPGCDGILLDGPDGHAVLTKKVRKGGTVRYWFGSCWNNGNVKSFGAWKKMAKEIAAEETLPELASRVFDVAGRQYESLASQVSFKTLPRTLDAKGNLVQSNPRDWITGFFPGSLWYIYQYTGDQKFAKMAMEQTSKVASNQFVTDNHDVGFIVNCSFGNAIRIGGREDLWDVMRNAAHSLASRFNPNVGCTQSWGKMPARDWEFPVIIDNMMNLELLVRVAQHFNEPDLLQLARTHAATTARNHFRPDYTTWHVLDYDPQTGEVRHRQTAQGYSDESTWGRGEAWALYGFTMMADLTGDPEDLAQAENIARWTLANLPEDGVQYWDYTAAAKLLANEKGLDRRKAGELSDGTICRDASSAAITASAFCLLSKLTKDKKLSKECLATSIKQVRALASEDYLALPGTNGGFILKHGTGHYPGNGEVDVPLSYGDYYFLEAVLRLTE